MGEKTACYGTSHIEIYTSPGFGLQAHRARVGVRGMESGVWSLHGLARIFSEKVDPEVCPRTTTLFPN